MPKRQTAQEVAQAIINAGFDQKFIERKIGINQSTVSRILTGDHQDPRSSTMDALRDLLKEVTKPKRKARREINKYLRPNERM